MKLTTQQLQISAWGLTALVMILAVLTWGQGYNWQVANTYQLFPVFGLLAFSVMWSQYMADALRQAGRVDGSALKTYFAVTGWMVLLLILIHPGLLAWQLMRDGHGLPPSSELHYVQPAWRWAIVLAMTAWLIFIAFEFRRWFGNRPWWKYMGYAVDLAMFFIFIHALRVGHQLISGWFRPVWFFYGASLIFYFVYKYTQLIGQPKVAKKP